MLSSSSSQQVLSNISDEELIPPFPSGPLDVYRSKASFDWRELKISLEGEEVIRFKKNVWDTLSKDKLFQRPPWVELNRQEERHITLLRLKKLLEYNFLTEEDMIAAPALIPAFIECLAQFDLSLAAKKFLSLDYFIQALRTTGSKVHSEYIDKVKNFQVLGALSITELSHGSNIAGIRTTATYDATSDSFILNTPDLEATKVWSGVLGQSATHAIVYAQLVTPDGKVHGVNQFLTPVRDPQTLLPYPGVLVGDMGSKLGMNGNDNGYMQFTNYRIAKSSLMNKNTEVTSDGQVVSRASAKRRKGVQAGVLSMGRISIVYLGQLSLHSALTIAVRYSTLRKQFGPKVDGTVREEWPVIEYQSQQWRLIPYIASSYILRNLFQSLQKDFLQFYADIAYGFRLSRGDEQEALGAEIHALASCAKAISARIARDGIQECREACGGHGYLTASRIGQLRNDHDPNLTHEGETYILLQQTSNYLMKNYRLPVNEIKSPLGSLDFLTRIDKCKMKRYQDLNDIQAVIEAYEFLLCMLLERADNKLKTSCPNGTPEEEFIAKADSQIFLLHTIAVAYCEYQCIKRFQTFLTDEQLSNTSRNVLNQVHMLFSLWILEKHLAELLEGGFLISGSLIPIRQRQLDLLKVLKNEAVALVDVLAPPDWVLNSCLAFSDGQVYQHIFESLSNSDKSTERPHYYQDFTENKPNVDSLKRDWAAKL